MRRHVIVIGAQRSGTTYLYRVLEEHPDIAMARPMRPEPKFFLDPQKTSLGLEWYEEAYFAHAGDAAILGEKSTSYIESPEAAQRAATMLPHADILVMLRDPLTRAVSNWMFSAASGLETRSLTDALAQNLKGPLAWDPEATSVSPFAYLERGRYLDYLRPWTALFGPRLHVLFTAELVGNLAAVSRLYDRLGVSTTHQPAALREKVNTSASPPPPLPDDLAQAVREWFADSDAALRDWLGRSLPWDVSVTSAVPAQTEAP